ncbi:ankyrin-1-like [Trichogramma pretiosum]|uniref:ankyrin-1-like n=1 Tax=Trichogramma pretiosum TaxID=7493 RepID=UPI0006C97DE5|nr:ankyrin-1-like [Trichogramma pretiosum]
MALEHGQSFAGSRRDANASGAEGSTAWHILCKKINDPFEKPFIDLFKHCRQRNRRLRINAQDALGNTPLHVFVQRSPTSSTPHTIDFLLSHGADLNLANDEGSTPLHIVCKLHGRDFLDDGRREVGCKLLENDANPNLADKKGMTPLHSALMNHNVDSDLIALMLRKGVDPNLADEQGMTPLHLDVKMKDQNLIESMLMRGGNLNLANKKGMTPFHFALEHNNEAWIIMLLKKGGDPNSANEEGMTFLHLVCSSRECDLEAADTLLELERILCNDEHRPLQIDARDKKGRTPLELAVANFWPLTVEAILERSVDVSNFVFPTESCFGEGGPWLSLEVRLMSKLKLVASAMAIVESLEKRGYEFYRSDALRIVKFFADNELFENA